MSTLRINNIEAKSVPASPTIDEKIKLTNSSGDVLVHIDGKTSGITTIGINTTDGNIKFDANSNIVVTGIITATKFVGTIEPTDLTVSGDLTISDKIIHSGDTNTAIRFPAADVVTVETGGSERFRVLASGGITVKNGDNQYSTTFEGGSSGSRNFVSVKAGNTTSGHNSGFRVTHSDGNAVLSALVNHNDDNANIMNEHQGGDLIFHTNESGSVAEKLRITSTGQLLVGTNSGGGTLRVFGSSGRIIIGDSSVNYYDGDTHSFRNYAASERLRIDSSGNMNLGSGATIAGLRYLDVQNASSAANNHGSILRLITSNAAGNSTTSVDIVKYKDGNFFINNNETSGSTNFNTGGATRLRISSNGYVTKPNHPSFIAGRTGGNQTFTVGTFPLNVARLNVGNHYNTSTYKFVAPVAGVYYFYGQVYYNNGTGTYRVGFRKTPNGGSALMLNTAQHGVTGNDNQQNISIIESLAVGDTVELYSDQNGAIQCYYNINDTNYGAHTYFMGYLIG